MPNEEMNVSSHVVVEYTETKDGVEIVPGEGCKLDKTKQPAMNPECVVECKKREPRCIAYSYNTDTEKCIVASDCLQAVYIQRPSASIKCKLSVEFLIVDLFFHCIWS